MIRWKKAAAAAAIAVTAALAVTSCAGGGTDGGGGEGGSGGTLTLGALFAPTTYDPSGAEWGNRSPYYQAVFDTLLLATPEGTIEPWLATEWSYNEDNTVLTLTLRDDVTFTDGTQLTARRRRAEPAALQGGHLAGCRLLRRCRQLRGAR